MTDQALVEEWLAKNGGPRRFERGVSGTPEGVRGYLQEHGYDLSYTGWRNGRKAIVKARRGRSLRPMTLHELLTFVDLLRSAESREPILRGDQ